MKIAIIGAGLGGLATSCLLAKEEHKVSVFEMNDSPGGKIDQITADGFRFDTGPSLLTMPNVLQSLFERCGVSLDNYLKLQPLDPICRYFYSDGTIFDCHQNLDATLNEIDHFAPEDRQNYRQFLSYSDDLFNHTKGAFIFNPLYNLRDLSQLNLLDFLKIDVFRTVANRVDQSFESGYLKQFFKRFTTYNGSSPFQAPATLNVIPHVELSLGGYYVKGGMYKIVDALYKLGRNLGVTFHFNQPIEHINVENKQTKSVQTKEKTYTANLVIANSDASETYHNLLPSNTVSKFKKRSIQSLEPSCSGFVLLLGIDRKYDKLQHHNIFFSENYRKEFQQIFGKKVMPDDPTIYIANTSASDPEDAPGNGSNLFILVNAPYLSDQWDWKKHQNYGDYIIKKLEEKGVKGLEKSIVFRKEITPRDFFTKYRANKGSIYGTSSNSKMAAFMRPKNKVRAIKGLYLVGGSTHPGGGIPLVIQSAFNAVELIRRYEKG